MAAWNPYQSKGFSTFSMFVSREAGAPALFAYMSLSYSFGFCCHAQTLGHGSHLTQLIHHALRPAPCWGQAVVCRQGCCFAAKDAGDSGDVIAVHRSRAQLRDLGGAHSRHVHVDHSGGICCAARVWCADLELCRPLFRRLTTACGVGRVGMTVPFGDILHSSQTEAGD